jgi:hypothetical protein
MNAILSVGMAIDPIYLCTCIRNGYGLHVSKIRATSDSG